jgi:hypothetical protein
MRRRKAWGLQWNLRVLRLSGILFVIEFFSSQFHPLVLVNLFILRILLLSLHHSGFLSFHQSSLRYVDDPRILNTVRSKL